MSVDSSVAEGAPPRIVTILHTNDFHNHLSAAGADVLRAARDSAGEDCLLVDAGDAISAGNVGVRPGGEPILTLMSEIGYDAMTLGNREFHVGDAILRHKIACAQFPILCANMRYRAPESKQPSPCRATLLKQLPGGVRVGLIGVTVPMVTETMVARHLSSFVFDEPIAAIQREADRLRPDVDLLIAITHIGIKADERLALSCPELDLIVTGHTHLLARPEERAGVPIVQAGWFGHHYGRVRCAVPGGASRPTLESTEILPLGAAT
jgi:5'-nucleotidase